MNGFDVQSATEVSNQFSKLARRAERFGYSRDDILEELRFLSKNYQNVANRIDTMMAMTAKVVV